ncbi:DUF3486 family protein [Luteolibacter flavescens]|uniref:DUF3486 family protein n=1 Tax=Luteolibacter flavescens TaxID=1859460 RepID=A0ABT3FKA7_9BACT|nr:phage protein Gp27 family protein [Luteolibacter flavescens]MCW1884006.1 DUF3486 family protein [Luteolibacter flavescens]
MSSDKKPRSDSKLDAMPESRVLELRDMLMAGAKYQDALGWLAVECGVQVSSSALTSFYRRHCAPLVRDKRKLAVLKSEALGDAMSKDPAKWDGAIIEKVKQRVFEFLDADSAKPEELMLVVDAVTKANKDRRDDKKAALEREKFEEQKRKARKAEEAEGVVGNDALSADEKQKRLKQIFGMG